MDLGRPSLVQGLSSLEGSCRPHGLDLTPFLGSSQAKHTENCGPWYLEDVTLEVKLHALKELFSFHTHSGL